MPDDPDTLVPLTTARTEFEGSTVRALLEDEGIPAHVFAASANALQWQGGYTNPIKIMVRRRDAQRAAEALAMSRRAAHMVDWSEVDVGEFEDGEPPAPTDQTERALWKTRVRRAGMILMFLPFLLPLLDLRGAIIAIIAAALVIALSWRDEV